MAVLIEISFLCFSQGGKLVSFLIDSVISSVLAGNSLTATDNLTTVLPGSSNEVACGFCSNCPPEARQFMVSLAGRSYACVWQLVCCPYAIGTK